MTACQHEVVHERSESCYRGSVSIHDENPRAHGGVRVEVECAACGARRSENRNGKHVEIGGWGSTREERADESRSATARVNEVRRIVSGRTATIRRGGDVVHVVIAADGYLLCSGSVDASEHVAALRACPALVADARALREAIAAAQVAAEAE